MNQLHCSATHVAYGDESHWNKGHFRSVALVSLERTALSSLSDMLRKIVKTHSLSELSWKHLKSKRESQAACDIVDCAVLLACQRQLRIDVLAWDITDSRHDIPRRDDVKNLQIMYHHVLKDVLGNRWKDEAKWSIHPDRFDKLDLAKEREILEYIATGPRDLHGRNRASQQSNNIDQELYRVCDIRFAVSAESTPIQLADLFAGLAVHSAEDHRLFSSWLDRANGQLELSGVGDDLSLSKRQSARFPVLKHLDEKCKSAKLGVSLNSKRRLWTPNPANPINFWWWNSQSEYDVAPVKST